MKASNAAAGRLTPQSELARRLSIVLDAAAERRGHVVTFPEVKAELAQRGVSLSRARWSYLKEGTGPLVRNKKLLTALSEVFDVPPEFLLDMNSDELPESIEARREFLRALRAARVQAFAARTLGDFSPDALRTITEVLNQEIQHQRGAVSLDNRLVPKHEESDEENQAI